MVVDLLIIGCSCMFGWVLCCFYFISIYWIVSFVCDYDVYISVFGGGYDVIFKCL